VSIIITRNIVINVVKGLFAKCYRDFEVVPGTGIQWITVKWTEAVLESAHAEDDQEEVPDNLTMTWAVTPQGLSRTAFDHHQVIRFKCVTIKLCCLLLNCVTIKCLQ